MVQADRYRLGNQDVDTSFITLEMTWKGVESDEIRDFVGKRAMKSFLEITRGSTINYYALENELKPFIELCNDAMLKNKSLRKQIMQGTVDVAGKMRQLAKVHIENVGVLSDTEIIGLLKEIRLLQAKCATLGTVVAFADVFGGVTDTLVDILKRRANLIHQLNVYSSTLGTPFEKSMTEKAYADIKKGSDAAALLKRYFWLDQGYIGRGLTSDQLGVIRRKEVETVDYDVDELRAELDLSADEAEAFEASRDIIRIKSLRADSRQFLHVLTNRIIDKLAERWGIDSNMLEVLHTDEICMHIKEGTVPESLDERWKHSVMVPDGESYRILVRDEAESFLKKSLMEVRIDDYDSVKGRVAQPGLVRGTVRLVFGPQHNDKVKEGDILISTATSPQLLPAMKRAAAFVTDVGGITSHAAIVAREMKKPCIVGTGHATQIFNDGDQAEVDTEKGTVTRV